MTRINGDREDDADMNAFAYRQDRNVGQRRRSHVTPQRRRLWLMAAGVAMLLGEDTATEAFVVQNSALGRPTGTQPNVLKTPQPLTAERTPTALHALQMSKNSGSSSSSINELEFELHVGKALDTLKKDYVDLLVQPPDYSIYCKEMELVDSSGVTIHGLRAYQNSFRLLHALIKFLYCPQKSGMTSVRMCYDPIKRNIRIHWNAQLAPREIFGGTRSILHADGISVYELDRSSGEIYQHRLEYLIMNNQAIRPKEGVVAALRQYHGVTVPSFCDGVAGPQQAREQKDLFTVPFLQNHGPFKRDSLFSADKDSKVVGPLQSFEASQSGGDNGGGSGADLVDLKALESKNKSRKKFGLAPLTPEEFMALQSHVKAMDAEQQIKRQQQAAAAAAQAEQEQKRRKRGGGLDKIFGSVLKDTCESNFDCERPEICCDFGFKKMCCSSGSPVLGQGWKEAVVPVPVETADQWDKYGKGGPRY